MRNIPNLLSGLRILMVPLFIYYYLSSSVSIAVVIFIAAGITDLLDGFIARKYHLISIIGTLLDPLADKLMLLSVLTCMTIKGIMPIWVTTIMYSKELFLVITSALLYFKHEKRATPSNVFGKLATVSFSAFIFLMLVMPEQTNLIYGIYLSMILKFTALLSYVLSYKKSQLN
jgi:cardiolipin synthase